MDLLVLTNDAERLQFCALARNGTRAVRVLPLAHRSVGQLRPRSVRMLSWRRSMCPKPPRVATLRPCAQVLIDNYDTR